MERENGKMKSTENSVTKDKHSTSAEVCYLAEFFAFILSLSLSPHKYTYFVLRANFTNVG